MAVAVLFRVGSFHRYFNKSRQKLREEQLKCQSLQEKVDKFVANETRFQMQKLMEEATKQERESKIARLELQVKETTAQLDEAHKQFQNSFVGLQRENELLVEELKRAKTFEGRDQMGCYCSFPCGLSKV